MTDESQSETDAWIKKHSASYAYGYSGEFIRNMEVSGYPTAFVISPAGEVLYNGSPSGVTDALIEKHLDGALSIPSWDWPKEAKATKKALLKNNLAKAITLASALDQNGVENGTEILAAVKKLAAGRAQAIMAAAEKGDFLAVDAMGKTLKKALKGLPEMETVNEALAKAKTSEAKKTKKGQKAVRKALEDAKKARTKKKAQAVVDALEKIAKKYSGTYAATEAQAHIEKLQARMQRMR